MIGKEAKLVIKEPIDIIKNLSPNKDFEAPAGGYVKVYSEFFTKYISKLIDIYTKYLNKKANKEDIKKIYEEYIKEINEGIERKGKEIGWHIDRYEKRNNTYDFWEDKQGKRNISIYNTLYSDGKDIPNMMFFVIKKKVYEEIEEYVDRFCEALDETERDDLKYRLLRIILNVIVYKEILENIEGIKKHIENVSNLEIDDVIEFLKEFRKIDDYIKGLEAGLSANDRRFLKVIDRRLCLINFSLYIWSDEETNDEDNAITIRRPVLGRISTKDKILTYTDAIINLLEGDEFIKQRIEKIRKTYKDSQERRKKLNELIENFVSQAPFNLKFMITRIYEEKKDYNKKRNLFLRTLEHVIGGYLELILTKKITSNVFETFNYYKNQVLANIRDLKIETESVCVYVLYSDKKAGEELIDLLNGKYKNSKGNNPIRYKNGILVGTNTNNKVSEDKKDIFIANISFISNLEELSKFDRPYVLDIRDIFLHYDELKKLEDKDGNPKWDEKTSNKVLFLMISANAFFIALEKHALKNETLPLLFACIDVNSTSSEERKYMFWEIVKIVARTRLFPLQTYNPEKRIKKEEDGSIKEETGMKSATKSMVGTGLQNLLFSATRNIRNVKMIWDVKDLNLSQKWDKNSLTLYIITENRTSKLFDYSPAKNIRAKFYEIFELKLKRDNRIVELDIGLWQDKETNRATVFSFGWDESTIMNIEKIINKLRAKSEYIFLLTLDKEILEKDLENVYKVFVKSITMPLLIEQVKPRKKETNALILHRKELLKFTELVKDNLTNAILGIHSIIPDSFIKNKKQNQTKQKQKELFKLDKNIKAEEKEEKYERFEKIIGSTVNLFWIDERIYNNPADIDIFTISVLSWLIFETDTASHPYVNPEWIKRKKGHLMLPLFLEREKKLVKFDTTTLIFELSDLVSIYEGIRRF